MQYPGGVTLNIDFNNVVPIYIQIANAIEDDILSGKLKEGDNCYSQIILAKELNINPATAAKGIRLLVERGILNKNRGQSMIVCNDANVLIKARKKEEILNTIVENLVSESKKLDISENELISIIKTHF